MRVPGYAILGTLFITQRKGVAQMIAQFKIKNFRSILDMTLDFRFTEGKAPNGYKNWDILPFLKDGADNRLVPCLAIFGANASGKTNILDAMATFRRITTDKDATTTTCFFPNKLHVGKETTLFELTGILDGNTYIYLLEFNRTEIRQEALTKDGAPLYEVRNQKGTFASGVCAEGYEAEKLQKILNVECSDGNGHQTSCFLKRIAQNYPGLNADLAKVFNYISKRLVVMEANDISLPNAVEMLSGFYLDDRNAALDEIVKIVRKLDIDIRSIAINRQTVAKTDAATLMGHDSFYRMLPDKGQFEIMNIRSIHHNMRGEPVEFNFITEESEGTKRVAGLVGMMLVCLKGGNTLFVDELENSLHPLLVKELIRLFKDKRYNTNSAQIIFTMHATDILDDPDLRLGEVAIVRKSEPAGTLVKRLVDFKKAGMDVRNVTKFRRQYLDGIYSGIPHPAL